jgi:hypothetical protein
MVNVTIYSIHGSVMGIGGNFTTKFSICVPYKTTYFAQHFAIRCTQTTQTTTPSTTWHGSPFFFVTWIPYGNMTRENRYLKYLKMG